jgi:hypothetical protein
MNEVTPKPYVRKLNPIEKKANWRSILDFHGVIYFLPKNTRLYTKAFANLPISRFSFHYKPSLDLARIMILPSRRGLRLGFDDILPPWKSKTKE